MARCCKLHMLTSHTPTSRQGTIISQHAAGTLTAVLAAQHSAACAARRTDDHVVGLGGGGHQREQLPRGLQLDAGAPCSVEGRQGVLCSLSYQVPVTSMNPSCQCGSTTPPEAQPPCVVWRNVALILCPQPTNGVHLHAVAQELGLGGRHLRAGSMLGQGAWREHLQACMRLRTTPVGNATAAPHNTCQNAANPQGSKRARLRLNMRMRPALLRDERPKQTPLRSAPGQRSTGRSRRAQRPRAGGG